MQVMGLIHLNKTKLITMILLYKCNLRIKPVKIATIFVKHVLNLIVKS